MVSPNPRAMRLAGARATADEPDPPILRTPGRRVDQSNLPELSSTAARPLPATKCAASTRVNAAYTTPLATRGENTSTCGAVSVSPTTRAVHFVAPVRASTAKTCPAFVVAIRVLPSTTDGN